MRHLVQNALAEAVCEWVMSHLETYPYLLLGSKFTKITTMITFF